MMTLAPPTACGYCGADDGEEMYPTVATNGDEYSFRSCQTCDGVYLSPRPTSEQLAEAYSTEYYGLSERKFIAPVEAVIERFRSARARRVAKDLPSAARVLDIGCGNGGFLHGLAKIGVEAHGIELPGGSADRALQIDDITVHVGTLKSSDYRHQTFDAITLWHVFEHLEQPRESLELIAGMLRPGGKLYLSLPNPESWQAEIFKGDWLHHDPPRHLFYLGPDALTRQVTALGFKREQLSFVSLEQNPFGMLQRMLNGVVPERDVLFESLKGNVDVTERHGRRSLWLQKLAGVALFPFCVLASTIESMAGRGATMELVFVRTGDDR